MGWLIACVGLGVCTHSLCAARGRVWHPRPAVVWCVVMECVGGVVVLRCVTVAEAIRILCLFARSSMFTPLPLQQAIATGAHLVPNLWQTSSIMLLCCRKLCFPVWLHARIAATCLACILTSHVPCLVCDPPFASPDCDFGEAGWRVILHALATAPQTPKLVQGLKRDFVDATDFDPAAVLRDLKWPVDLLQQPNPDTAIPQFCRELHKGAHSGDPVASLLLLGPGGAGKSTLLHRLTQGEFNTSIKSTDGLRIGA